jgi:hypothetical protein
MSDRARVEYPSETLQVSHPAPLRPPSPAVQAEALRRHLAGDATPVKTDGDPSWTSRVGQPMANRGTFEGHADTATVPHPRNGLKKAIKARYALSSETHRLGAELKDADDAEAAARAELDHLAATSRHELSVWADGDRFAPAPVNSLQKRTELEAGHQSAKRKAIALRDAYKAAESVYTAKAPEAEKVLREAMANVVIAEAEELKEERLRLQIEIARINAMLSGLESALKAAGSGTAAARVVRAIDPVNAKKQAAQPELAEIEKAAFAFPKLLLSDPTAEL